MIVVHPSLPESIKVMLSSIASFHNITYKEAENVSGDGKIWCMKESDDEVFINQVKNNLSQYLT